MSDERPRPPRRPGEPPSGSRRPADREQGREVDPYDYESIFTEELGPAPGFADRIPRVVVTRAAIAIGVIVVLLVCAVYVKKQTGASKPNSEINVEVPAGASFNAVATLLQQKHVVPSSLFLRLWAKVGGGAPNVRAGEYAFVTNSSDSATLSVLRKGPKPLTDRLVIPEGFGVAQIAERVGQIPGMSAQKFYDLATSGTIRSDYEPATSKNLEGLLYPDTYLLSSSDNETTLLQRMVNEFDNEAKLISLDSSNSGIAHTPYETVIIASMIEAEAKVPADRGKVSQVIENRLFKAMPLQIDATVIYAMGNTTRNLSTADLKFNSPYNTYLHLGLPPAPICSPGAAALQAALQPTPGPWLYYVVTSSDGGESFATTLAEQNANIKLAQQRGVR